MDVWNCIYSLSRSRLNLHWRVFKMFCVILAKPSKISFIVTGAFVTFSPSTRDELKHSKYPFSPIHKRFLRSYVIVFRSIAFRVMLFALLELRKRVPDTFVWNLISSYHDHGSIHTDAFLWFSAVILAKPSKILFILTVAFVKFSPIHTKTLKISILWVLHNALCNSHNVIMSEEWTW